MSLKSALDKLIARQEEMERRFDILFPEVTKEGCQDRVAEIDDYIDRTRDALSELVRTVGMEDLFPYSEYRAGR